MGVGARVFKGRCTPAEKRRKRDLELEPVYRNLGGSYEIHRRRASAAHGLMAAMFTMADPHIYGIYGRRK